MTDVVVAEWIKLRTVRSHWVLAVIAFAFPAAITVLSASLAGTDDMGEDFVVAVATGTSIVSAMLWGVIGTLGVAQEASHGTLRVTFSAVPRRRKVVVAKVGLVGAAAAAAVGAALVASVMGGVAIASARGADVSIGGAPGSTGALVGTVVLTVLVTWLGTGIGMIVRNVPAAISALVLWPLLAENLVGGLLFLVFGEGVTKFLPYTAGTQLAIIGDVDGGWGSRWAAGGYFAVWVVAVLAIGALLTERRDA